MKCIVWENVSCRCNTFVRFEVFENFLLHFTAFAELILRKEERKNEKFKRTFKNGSAFDAGGIGSGDFTDT